MRIRSLSIATLSFAAVTLLSNCGRPEEDLLPAQRPLFFKSEVIPASTYLTLDPLQTLENSTKDILQSIYGRNDITTQQISINTQHSPDFDLITRDYALKFDGISICDSQMKIHDINGKRHAFTNLPQHLGQVKSFTTVSDNDFKTLVATHFAVQQDMLRVDILEKNVCYQADLDGSLSLASAYIFRLYGLTYKALMTPSELISFQPHYLTVDGEAEVFATNPLGSLKTFTLNNLTGRGMLENQFFQTAPEATKAISSNHNFTYEENDPRFSEASLFVHANEQLNFFSNLGYKWSSTQRLTLIPGALVNGSPNNALYAFGTTDAGPQIIVGEGDGKKLTNLAKDRDVIAHEFGHHVLFETLQEPYGETVVLHEGLADFFAHVHDNNACLAESICTSSGSLCEIKASCLRTAENDYILNKNTKKSDHEKSQFLSGMLWDLRAEINPDILTQLVFDATRILMRRSGYRDFILALLLIDQETHRVAYCTSILNASYKRGLQPYLDGIECGQPLPSFSAFPFEEGDGTSSKSSKRHKDKLAPIPNCGTLGNAPKGSFFVILILLTIGPLLAPILIKRRYFTNPRVSS